MVYLFASALKIAYGIDSVSVVNDETESAGMRELSQPGKAARRSVGVAQKSDVTDTSWLDELHPKVRALVGTMKLPPEHAEKSYDELKDEYFAEKYGVFR